MQWSARIVTNQSIPVDENPFIQTLLWLLINFVTHLLSQFAGDSITFIPV